MAPICKTCQHLYVGGSKCPVCNYPNEETHERHTKSPSGKISRRSPQASVLVTGDGSDWCIGGNGDADRRRLWPTTEREDNCNKSECEEVSEVDKAVIPKEG